MIPRKLLFLTIVSLLPAIANADVVSRLDSVNNGVGVGFPQNSLGMSLTTPDADEGWNNLEFNFLTRGYFKTCSGLRQKSQLAFKTKGILANPTTMIARF
jgi:hypothetical protein